MKSLKGSLVNTGKHALSGLAMEFLGDDFVAAAKELLAPYEIEDIGNLMAEGKFIDISDANIAKVAGYKSFLNTISFEESCEFIFDLIQKARPDIAMLINATGDDGVEWLAKGVRDLRSKVLAEPQKAEESQKPKLTKAVCTACGKEWILEKKDAEKLKACPFCGEPYGDKLTPKE